jgi:hypothetical protein
MMWFRKAMAMVRRVLMIFMRYPEPGKVKSRLAGAIGAGEAAAVYERLLRRTLGIAADFKRSQGAVDILLFYAPAHRRAEVEARFRGPWHFIPQGDGHLGEKMAAGFRAAACLGYQGGVLVGTDIADLQIDDLMDAFQVLESHQAVLGPATDGGFYLIGLQSPCDSVFQFDEWGTAGVFHRAFSALSAAGRQARTIATRSDIDRKEDVLNLCRTGWMKDRLSIIIPITGDIGEVLPLCTALEAQSWPGDEIIVVQGRNGKAHERHAISSCTQVLVTARGRGLQLNHGAHAARGELLWFLHSDCLPPHNFGYHIRKIADAPRIALGCFELAFQPANRSLRMIAAWANRRARCLKLPYGDQGLFCRRQTFSAVGGFRKPLLMEDVDFARATRKCGELMVIPEPIMTSPRRYLSSGILRTSLRNHLTLLRYYLGTDDRKLYQRYYAR